MLRAAGARPALVACVFAIRDRFWLVPSRQRVTTIGPAGASVRRRVGATQASVQVGRMSGPGRFTRMVLAFTEESPMIGHFTARLRAARQTPRLRRSRARHLPRIEGLETRE